MFDFALVIHNHQPVENDDEVIEQVYRMAYSPFLRRLARFPEIKVNLHYSGYLLEWLEGKHPEFIELLKELVDREQAEIIGGGYYEPILPVIPDKDALGQIALLSEKITTLFGTERRPNGLWLAERAWEPNLPEILSSAGIRYTLLDDSVFHMSGLSERDCFFPYVTESRGSNVLVFPILKKLRYYIPFKNPAKTLSYLKSKKSEDADLLPIAIFGDDGEKFGAWPTTYKEVYTRKWLENFFELVCSNSQWLETVRLTDYIKKLSHKFSRKIYLPAASYQELMEWSLPAKPHIRPDSKSSGGFWRLFLSKYAEGSELYARMLSVSALVNGFRGEDRVKRKALSELWKAQYNDVYWHGIFGGLYFPRFRRVAYSHLLRAQTLIESYLHRFDRSFISIQNYGNKIKVDTRKLGLSFCPSFGGSLTEIDYKPLALNLTDSLARRFESYHEKILKERGRPPKTGLVSIHETPRSKEAGLKDLLVYDRYPKASFLDYLLEGDTSIRDFHNQEFVELAGLAGHSYDAKIIDGSEKSIKFSRSSSVGDTEMLNLNKRFTVSPERSFFSIDYDLELRGRSGIAKRRSKTEGRLFAVEINLGSLGDPTFEGAFDAPVERMNTRALEIAYGKLGVAVSFEFEPPAKIWIVPVRSVSQSEQGFESNLQGVSIVPNFEIKSESSRFQIGLSINKIL